MNALASSILWLSIQVAIFSLVGSLAFFAVRRRGPQAGATCTAIVLAFTLILTLLAVSPWPRWVLHAKPQVAAAPTNLSHAEVIETVEPAPELLIGENNIALAPAPSLLETWWETAVEFVRTSNATPAAEESSYAGWRTWLFMLVAGGVGLCCVRLMLGLWAVSSLRRNSQRIEDGGLLAAVESIARKVGASSVDVRETSLLRSAVTIGWRKPVLLLPQDWSTWTEAERRAVLAHELVHVARSDYATAFLARVATAIHFYQPLVLWLNRQLRMQQELAADAQAAEISGDRKTYLTTLAQLALRADEQPLPWAARAFLPNTSSLIKRVAWLKRKGAPMEKTLGNKGRWLLAGVMAAIALAVAGIRGPGNPANSVLAQQPAQTVQPNAIPQQPKQGQGTLTLQGNINPQQPGVADQLTIQITNYRTTKYVPADVKLLGAISPNAISKLPSLEKLIPVFGENGFEKTFGLTINDLADVQVMKVKVGPGIDRAVLRSAKPFDWKRNTLDRAFKETQSKESNGKTYYLVDIKELSKFGDLGPAFFVADETTLIAGSEEEIRKVVAGNEEVLKGDPAVQFSKSMIAGRADIGFIKSMLGDTRRLMEAQPMLAMLLPVLDHAKVATFSASPVNDPKSGVDWVGPVLMLDCDTPAGAEQIAKTMDAARTLVTNLLAAKAAAWRAENAPPVPQEQIVAMGEFIEVLQKALTTMKIQSEGTQAWAAAELKVAPPVVAAFLMPALASSREAAMRTQSMNNLKQIGLAMHLYADVKKQFPPAAIRSADGKPLLSWRVAILPYLEQHALYAQFHLDEPWDSEHNKKLIDKMPPQLRDPHEPAGSTNASYFMPTGKGTFGENEKGNRMADIVDGTSQTIMVIDAKRDIPWTKPEDIEIDPDSSKPLPKFGGNLPDGLFNAAIADGSVRVVAGNIDSRVLRALLTIAGHDPIPVEDPAARPESSNAQPPADSNAATKTSVGVEGGVAAELAVNPSSLSLGTLLPGQSVTKNIVLRSTRAFKVLGVFGGDSITFKLPEVAREVQLVPITFTAGKEVGSVIEKLTIKTDLNENALLQVAVQATILNPTEPAPRTPPAKPASTDSSKRDVSWEQRVALRRDQQGKVVLYWNDVRLDEIDFRRRLEQLPNKSEHTFQISAENDTPYKDVTGVIDMLHSVGIRKVSLPVPLAQIGVGVHSDAGLVGQFSLDKSPVKIEFRRGETQPAAGLAEMVTPDAPGKVFVVNESGITNADIADASVVKDPDGRPAISIAFTPQGSEKMKKLSEQQMGKPLVIMLNGKVIAAPRVMATISGKAQISGSFTQAEAEKIAKGILAK